MSMTYANISDPVVLADYQSVLKPGAVIAGPLADTLRTGQLGQDSLDWIKTNFYKTELELGHCLRLPQEGPCECDLYLTCAKFVTTPQYAPRLRDHRADRFLAPGGLWEKSAMSQQDPAEWHDHVTRLCALADECMRASGPQHDTPGNPA